MKLLTTKDVLKMMPVSSVTLWRMVKRGDIPQPIKITEHSPNLYKLEWIEDFINSKIEEV